MKITPIYIKNYKQTETNYHLKRQAELEAAFQTPEYWQILQRAEERKRNSGRILKLKTNKGNKEIHVEIKTERKTTPGTSPVATYHFYDGLTNAGYVEMEEKTDGAYIAFIENKIPEMYGGVERLSLLLAVANCLNRGLKNFKITGVAINDSHAIHYLAGMRFGKFDNRYRAEKAKRWFGTSDINKIIKTIIENTPAGSKYCTSMLGCINMHLLQSVIKSITEYLKKHPVLF